MGNISTIDKYENWGSEKLNVLLKSYNMFITQNVPHKDPCCFHYTLP